MEEPLRALKLAPRGMGPPELKALAESKTPSGGYALSMTFYAPNTPYRVWKDRMVRRTRPCQLLFCPIRSTLGRRHVLLYIALGPFLTH